jgi:LuxR family transcriptional regulator, maltose regulon positive regulatory protein
MVRGEREAQERPARATRARTPQGSAHLINSKLKPPLAAVSVLRADLLARLDDSVRRKLALLSAPIGSGKTTLLTQWYAQSAPERAVAWLSLDEQDNEPTRFFSYLIGAVKSAAPAFDAYIAMRRDDDEQRLIDAAAAIFSERLNALDLDLVIVIDDFQHLTARALERAFDFLLRRSPPNVHWLVSGRCLPDISLGNLRLSDQLTMFGAEDLRFDAPLIVELSRKLCRRALSLEDAEYIRERTEGWVAGAKLALLARDDPRSAGEALQSFAGSHFEVARYLSESVLQEQSPAMREFLVASSIVDRMTGELCDAMLGVSDSQCGLERLERAQLFIQPLDGHHCWYRYHTLFRDFLRSCLRRDQAALIPLLHERASRWYAEHQLLEEALEHAFAARNQAWRNELLARCSGLWLQSGEIADVLRWTERLPQREITSDPAICRSYIAALILSRRFEDAAIALRDFREIAALDALGAVHLRLLTTMFAILTDQEGELSFDDAEMLRTPGADGFLGGTLLTLQAYVLLRKNQFDAARRVALRARNVLQNVSTYGLGYADVVASLADRAQGDIKMATTRCEGMFAAVRSGRRNPAWVNAATALAYIRYEENRLADAESLCLDVLPLLSIASTIENMTSAYVTLARTKAIGKRLEEASQLLDSLESVLEGGAHHRFLAQLWGEKIRCALLEQNPERAWTLAREYGLEHRAQAGEWRMVRTYDEAWERSGSAYALVLAASMRYVEAQRILTVLRDSARGAGYVYRELRLETRLASCCDRAGERDAAFEALNRAFSLTRGFGFTRGVFDETPGLTRLLKAAVEQGKLRHPLPSHYLRKFENVFAGRALTSAPTPYCKAPLPLEPLTDREIDMLKLLAQGFSNSEISERSQIALSTAKWHLKNVFAKLDVSTRTSALARARELRLVD